MATPRGRSRCRDRRFQLTESTSDLDSFRREAIVELRRAIDFVRWSTLLVDPDTLALTRGIGLQDRPFYAALPRLVVHDGRLDDVGNLVALARSRTRVGVLSAATAGDLARSRRWLEFYAPYGIGDELRTIIADERGSWGTLQLFRDSDDRPFTVDDAELMREASPVLARALRRGAVAPVEGGGLAPAGTGVILLGNDLTPHSTTATARAWCELLDPARMPYPAGIPTPIWSVVGRLLAAESGEEPERPPRARVRGHDGSWAMVEAERLEGGGGGLAISIHSAASHDVLDLLCRAHGLSERERQLIALVVDGLDTRQVAARLSISRHTVQDHLKSVFAKVGVHSRRELVSGFFAHAS